MTKAELVDAVAEAAGVSKADAERTIGAYWDTVVSSVQKRRQGVVAGHRFVQPLEARSAHRPQPADR